MMTPHSLRTALRARRTGIAVTLVLAIIVAVRDGVAWAAGGVLLLTVSMLLGSWLDVRRGGAPLLSRRQSAAVCLALGLVLTVVAVALS